MPSVADFAKQQEINRDAGIALLDKIGPAILLTHSQSGAMGWPIADARPNLVKAIVAVEPSGPPVHDVEFKGAPDWFADAAKTKIWGLGEVPLTYDPPGAPEFVREDKPDAPDLARCWLQKGQPRQLDEPEGHPGAGGDVGGLVSRELRPLHREVSARRPASSTTFMPARRQQHPRQRPHDDAGEEQRPDRGRDGLAGSDAGQDKTTAR